MKRSYWIIEIDTDGFDGNCKGWCWGPFPTREARAEADRRLEKKRKELGNLEFIETHNATITEEGILEFGEDDLDPELIDLLEDLTG